MTNKPKHVAGLDVWLFREWARMVDALPASKWVLKDFIMAEALTVISGDAGRAWKSWTLFQMALCVASGRTYGLLEPGNDPQGVLIFETEGPRKPTRWRFRALENGSKLDTSQMDNFYFNHLQQVNLSDRRQMREIAAFCHGEGIKMVAFDTLAKMLGGDENSSQDMGRAMQGIDLIRATGAGVVVIHHLSKQDPKSKSERHPNQQLRGSSALDGFMDLHIAIRKQYEDQPHYDWMVYSNEAEDKFFQATWMLDKKNRDSESMEDAAYLNLVRVNGPTEITDLALDVMVSKLVPDFTYNKFELSREMGFPSWKKAQQSVEHLIEEGILITAGGKFRLK